MNVKLEIKTAYYATCVNTEGSFICEFQEEVIKDRLCRRKGIIIIEL